MTAQVSEHITFRGKGYSLGDYEFPLESLFIEPTYDDEDDDLEKVPDIYKIPRPDFSEYARFITSTCWRNYLGIWNVSNDRLELQELCTGEVDYLQILFPEKTAPVHAYWFSGTLNILGHYNRAGEWCDSRGPDTSNVSMITDETEQLVTIEEYFDKEEFTLEIHDGMVTDIKEHK